MKNPFAVSIYNVIDQEAFTEMMQYDVAPDVLIHVGYDNGNAIVVETYEDGSERTLWNEDAFVDLKAADVVEEIDTRVGVIDQ